MDNMTLARFAVATLATAITLDRLISALSEAHRTNATKTYFSGWRKGFDQGWEARKIELLPYLDIEAYENMYPTRAKQEK